MARYSYGRYGHNPEVLGLDVGRGVAAASGVYLAKNVGAILTSFLPGVAAMVDGVRPGLSTGAMETIAAAAIAGFIGPMLPISSQHKGDVALGATAIAASDVIASVFGQVNLLQGQPNFSGGVTSAVSGAAKALPKMGAGMLPATGNQGGYQNLTGISSGTTAQAVMSTSALTGVGTMGF